MSLETTVAAPFKREGARRMGEGDFVVALSLHLDWFTPDQAKRVVDVATGRGLLSPDDDDLVAEFDPADVTVPEEFVPDEEILREQSAFERALDALVDAGFEKQEAVAGANRLQRELGVTIETAAVVFARRHGVDIDHVAEATRETLLEEE